MCVVACTGCEAPAGDPQTTVPYRQYILDRLAGENVPAAENSRGPSARMLQTEPEALPTGQAATQPARRSLLAFPPAEELPPPAEILLQMPDPQQAPEVLDASARRLEQETRDERAIRTFERVRGYALELLGQVRRPVQVELSLAQAVQRALDRNYAIRIVGHNPAIAQTQIVEAEAAFDTVFFLDSSWDNQDPPRLNRLIANQSDTRGMESGIRQLLPTGLQASTSLRFTRVYQQSLEPGRGLSGNVRAVNPTWASDFIATLRQPLLRGFGLEFNRSQINIAKADYAIAQEQFLRQVRDTLFDVESAYWNLVRARRDAAIVAVSVAQNRATNESVVQRLGHDATEVEVANSRARYESRQVDFLETIKLVRDAEDVLKFLVNDENLRLSQEAEIIPTTPPSIVPFALDQFAEVRTALDHRNEIAEAKLNIERARIGTAVAKNQTLPQLDLVFNYDVGGLGKSADSAFDEVTTNDYRSYTLSAQFSYPIGNRGPRAALRRARELESQAVVTLQQAVDAIIRDVNETVRQILVRFAQISPGLEAARAAERNLRALQARSQRIDPNFLETELSAVEQLNNARRTLLQVITDYNIAIVSLERAKGTLLQYNNVVILDEKGRSPDLLIR